MTTRKWTFCLHLYWGWILLIFCSVLFGFRKCNKINSIAHPLRIPGICDTSTTGTSFFHFWSINTIKPMRASDLLMFLYGAEPKDVRVLLPMQLILDCHWLVCVRGEGLTDRSIGSIGAFKVMSDTSYLRVESTWTPPQSRYYEWELKIFFMPRVSELGACQWKKRVGCNGRSQRLKICSVGKVVEMNKMIFFLMCNKTI